MNNKNDERLITDSEKLLKELKRECQKYIVECKDTVDITKLTTSFRLADYSLTTINDFLNDYSMREEMNTVVRKRQDVTAIPSTTKEKTDKQDIKKQTAEEKEAFKNKRHNHRMFVSSLGEVLTKIHKIELQLLDPFLYERYINELDLIARHIDILYSDVGSFYTYGYMPFYDPENREYIW